METKKLLELARKRRAEENLKKNQTQIASWLTENGHKYLSPEKMEDIRAHTEVWYKPENVLEREIAYMQKVNSHKEEFVSDAEKADLAYKIHNEYINRVNAKLAKKGRYISALPDYQTLLLRAIASIHIATPAPKVKMNFDTSKGICLIGPVGIGKTDLFEHCKQFAGFNYRVVSALEIKTEVDKNGPAALESYKRCKCIVLDEIGREDVAVHFGRNYDCIPEIIHHRYQNGLLTHITSNFKPQAEDKAEQWRYEDYIRDRVYSLCNVIELGNNLKSYR